jgi:hypothetical protein
MNLTEAKITTIVTAPKVLPPLADKAEERAEKIPDRAAEVVDGEVIVCPHCEVPGSKPVLDEKSEVDVMVCDICSAIWPEAEPDYADEESDLEEALGFLVSVSALLDVMIHNPKLRKLGWEIEKNVMDMATDIDKFLENFPWKED